MEFAHRSDIETFEFLSRKTVTIISPELRQKRPVMRSLVADIADNGLLLYKTVQQFHYWNFPLQPGFFIKYDDKVFVCTRIRELMGLHYILCDVVPTDEPLSPLTDLYLTEDQMASYHFGPLQAVTLTTSESRTSKTATRSMLASPSEALDAFKLEKTNSQMKRLCFPQKPGFVIEHRTGKYITTRIRYAPGRNYLVCDVIPI